MLTRALWLCLWSTAALAQTQAPEDWQTPEFQVPVPHAARVEVPPKAPAEPKQWQLPHVFLVGTASFGTSSTLGVRAGAGVVLGRPARDERFYEAASGFTVTPQLHLGVGKVHLGLCGSAVLCGTRVEGGPAVRGAWSIGHISEQGVVRPVHTLFVVLAPFIAGANVPSQPLLPGARWLEGGARLEVGAMSSFRWPPAGARYVVGGLILAAQFEWLAVRRADSGAFRGGLSFGLAL